MTRRVCSCAEPREPQLQSAAIPFPYGERVRGGTCPCRRPLWACRRAPRSQRASMAGALIERPTTRETTAFAPELVVLTTIARRRADELEMAAAIDHDGGAGADREMGNTGEDRSGNVAGLDHALQRGRLGARFERRAVADLDEIGGHRAR